MNNKVVVLTENDTYISLEQWQGMYKLDVSSNQIGRHFNIDEYKFKKDIEDYGVLIVCAPLMRVMDAYREAVNESVNVNAYNRNEAKQQELRDKNLRDGTNSAATTSPHVYKMAVDMDTRNEAHTLHNVPILKQAAKNLGIPIRVGYKSYAKEGKSFIHLDVCPLYYAKGRPRHDENHPAVWEYEIEW